MAFESPSRGPMLLIHNKAESVPQLSRKKLYSSVSKPPSCLSIRAQQVKEFGDKIPRDCCPISCRRSNVIDWPDLCNGCSPRQQHKRFIDYLPLQVKLRLAQAQRNWGHASHCDANVCD